MFFYRERTCEDSTEIFTHFGRSFSRPHGPHAVTRLSAESKIYFLVVSQAVMAEFCQRCGGYRRVATVILNKSLLSVTSASKSWRRRRENVCVSTQRLVSGKKTLRLPRKAK